LIPNARFTTMVILLINFGFYLATALHSMRVFDGDPMSVSGQTLFLFGAKHRDAILAGQWWRLITAGFLHGGILHILMNSWVIFDLGTDVEELYGTSRMLVIYFLATILGFAASTWWSPSLSIGASAGLFGLIGAMIAAGFRLRSAMGDAVRRLYLRWAIYGFLFGVLPFVRTDNAAHLGGLAAGFAVAYVAGFPSAFNTWVEKLWRVGAWLAVALTALAFIKMFLWFQAWA
jgi:rhomboid protease GluP